MTGDQHKIQQLRVAAESCIRQIEAFLLAPSDRKKALTKKSEKAAQALKYLVEVQVRNHKHASNEVLEKLRKAA
jgi:hypothetical protein